MARTLDDLAELSGVSRATVSRVINGGAVSPETRQKVLDVLETTNYRPNLAARNLASGKSGVVGVVMHVAAQLTFSDNYFANLLTGICDSLTESAAGMMLWLGNRTKEETLDQILSMGMLDGIIVTADTMNDPLVDGLRSSGVPSCPHRAPTGRQRRQLRRHRQRGGRRGDRQSFDRAGSQTDWPHHRPAGQCLRSRPQDRVSVGSPSRQSLDRRFRRRRRLHKRRWLQGGGQADRGKSRRHLLRK